MIEYWEEFLEKYGFKGGEMTPPDARAVRKVLVSALNAIAIKLGSEVRAVPFNRQGMHNGVMVVYRPVGSDDTPSSTTPPDDAMQRSLYILNDMDMNGDFSETVHTEVTVDEHELDEILDDIDDWSEEELEKRREGDVAS